MGVVRGPKLSGGFRRPIKKVTGTKVDDEGKVFLVLECGHLLLERTKGALVETRPCRQCPPFLGKLFTGDEERSKRDRERDRRRRSKSGKTV